MHHTPGTIMMLQQYGQIGLYPQLVVSITTKSPSLRRGAKGRTTGRHVYAIVLTDHSIVSIGFSGAKAALEKLPGWEPDSWGYHSDDGKTYLCGSPGGKSYGDPYGAMDIIGCGINFRTNEAFFTKNGNFIGRCDQCPHLLRLTGIRECFQGIKGHQALSIDRYEETAGLADSKFRQKGIHIRHQGLCERK